MKNYAAVALFPASGALRKQRNHGRFRYFYRGAFMSLCDALKQ
jgi:hypothetical protein